MPGESCRNSLELSDREISRRVILSHTTIAALRAGQNGQSRRLPERQPGEIPADVGLFDTVRFGSATRTEKSVAGYFKRLAIALADPYDDDSNPTLLGWSTDPLEIARACYAAMGAEKASELLEILEIDAQFILDVARTREQLGKAATKKGRP